MLNYGPTVYRSSTVPTAWAPRGATKIDKDLETPYRLVTLLRRSRSVLTGRVGPLSYSMKIVTWMCQSSGRKETGS